ncbi:DNA mismatch repair protein MutT [Tupanvirus soda lake]|uniref:DNA mismatch repair protein MutT n=2 Tax=Tupanvirus TaxID=2094720 RepID=A0A6N1NT53_9VIRU|nr:DNA mismatch repair protein MutT [Tupanvirus soda lake]QKU34846.1 DNA mismatch repair protein MutT [Tupanvirus soda lake]
METKSKRQLKKEKKAQYKLDKKNKIALALSSKPKLITDYQNNNVDGCGIILLTKQKNNVFLLLRFCNGIFYIPKGHRKIGENARDGAIRELERYTGIQINNYKLLDTPFITKYKPYYHNSGYKYRGHYVNKTMYIFFALTDKQYEVKTNEYGSYDWINLSDIPFLCHEENIDITSNTIKDIADTYL